MRTDFTAVTDALDNLIAILSEKVASLIGIANGQRVEMLDLRQRMADTADDLDKFGTILDDAGKEICAAGDICSDIADKIHAALADSDKLPSCNYEDFVAICEECGADIAVDSDYEIDDNGHTLCAECSALYKGLTDGEQTTMDIPKDGTGQVIVRL